MKRYIDSLETLLSKAKEDTSKVFLLRDLCIAYRDQNSTRAYSYSKLMLNLSERLNFKVGIAMAYFHMGASYDNQSDYESAMKYYFKSIELAEEIHREKTVLLTCNAIGIIYNRQKNYNEALKFYLKGLEIAERLGNEQIISSFKSNIGVLYKNLKNYDKSVEYHKGALASFEKIGYKKGVIASYLNLGVSSYELGKVEESTKWYLKVVDMASEMGAEGNEYMITAELNLGESTLAQGKYDESLKRYTHCLELINESGFRYYREQAKGVYEGLAKLYSAKKDFRKAYEYQNNFMLLKDSLLNEDIATKVNEMSTKYEEAKKQKEITELQNKNEIVSLKMSKQRDQLKKNRTILYLAVGGILLILVLLSVLYNRYQVKQRANLRLEEQNKIIAEKKKEIQDSINYAKNIQRAILPKAEDIYRVFPECFGLYKPKDVVSGDFYWFAEQDNKIFIAAADCTGHGVPGGFMSMIGIDKLNTTVLEKQVRDPGQILKVLNRSLKGALKQNDMDSKSRDGMDIALCVFNKDKSAFEFAGANRPLWIIRKGAAVIEEVPPTKAAIGGLTSDDQEFESHRFTCAKGDTLYFFTDGFADQFGGDKGKKFMTRNMKSTLLEIQHMTMAEQEKYLDELFEKWRGTFDQLDDVLVLGIRI